MCQCVAHSDCTIEVANLVNNMDPGACVPAFHSGSIRDTRALTPDVIRATARLAQINERLSEVETRTLVTSAEAAGDTVVMVEIDPREGSGVIPNDWQAFLQPENRPDRAVRGTITPQLREVKALAGVLRRNYDYDRFWVTFPLTGPTGGRLFSSSDRNAELVVRIYEKEGHVGGPIPASLR